MKINFEYNIISYSLFEMAFVPTEFFDSILTTDLHFLFVIIHTVLNQK